MTFKSALEKRVMADHSSDSPMNHPQKQHLDPTPKDRHSFPVFESAGHPLGQRKGASRKFKPLFSGGASSYASASPSTRNDTCAIDPTEKEQVCCTGFQNGFERGKQDACRLAKETIEPCLIDFLQAFENVSAFHQHVTENASRQIIELARGICERILGASIHMDDQSLDLIRNEIQLVITKAHQLTLRLDPQDLDAIQDLMAGFNLSWPQSEAVGIKAASRTEGMQPVAVDQPQDPADMEHLLTDRLPKLFI